MCVDPATVNSTQMKTAENKDVVLPLTRVVDLSHKDNVILSSEVPR